MTSLALYLVLLAAPAAEGPGPRLLDFHSEGCGPCRAMRPRIDLLKSKGYPIRSIDLGESPELAARYNISAVPAFIVVDARGRALARSEGLQPAAELAALYNNAVAKLEDDAPPAEAAVPAPARPRVRNVSESRAVPALPRPWQTVVRIKIHNPPHSIGFGSGTIIYSSEEESIILTCAHIFHIEGQRRQPPPQEFPRKITIDLFDGKITGLKPAKVSPLVTGIPGEAIDYDFSSDVGLIRIRPGRRLPASPVVPAGWKPAKGAEMITVGCSEGDDATAWSTRISGDGVAQIDGRSYKAIECLIAPKLGRSGGGLYTRDGYIVGVCDFADRMNNRGLYADTSSIYRLLDRNRLTALYQAPPPPAGEPKTYLADNRNAAPARRPSPSDAPKLRAQSPREGEIPMPDPSVFGARVPADDLADSTAGATRRRIAWRAVPVTREQAAVEPEPDPAADALPEPSFDPVDAPAAELTMDRADGPLADDAAELPADAPAPAAAARGQVRWQPVVRSAGR